MMRYELRSIATRRSGRNALRNEHQRIIYLHAEPLHDLIDLDALVLL